MSKQSTLEGAERHIRNMWAAGTDVDGIAAAMSTHRAGIAQVLQQFDDEELAEGLRVRFSAIIAARARSKLR